MQVSASQTLNTAELSQLRKELMSREERVEFVETNMASMRKELISNDDLIARLRTEIREVTSGRSSVALTITGPESAAASGESTPTLQRELANSRTQLQMLTTQVTLNFTKWDTPPSCCMYIELWFLEEWF